MANTAYSKANNTTELTVNTSWTPNGVLDSTDLGAWSLGANTVTASTNTFTAGAIQLTSTQSGAVTIQQPVTLSGLATTVGGLAAGTALQIDGGQLLLERAVTVATSQVWNVATSSIYIGNGNTAGLVSAANGITLTKKGSGTLALMRNNPGLAAGSTIDVQEGPLNFSNGNNTSFGSSSIILNSLGTGLYVYLNPNFNNSTATTLANTVTVKGKTYFLNPSSGTTVMTLSGTVNIVPASGVTSVEINVPSSSVTLTGAITGTAGFTKAGTGTLLINGSAKAIDNSVPGTAVTVTGGGGLGLGDFNSGVSSQLASISAFVLNNGVANRGVEYAGTTAYTEDANFTGSSGTVQTSNTAGLTFSGDLSAFAGTFGVYNTVADTTAIWQTAASFPASVTQFRYLSDTNSRTLTMRYTGSGNVSNSAGTLFLSPNSGTGVTMTSVMENASTSGATMTFGGPVTAQQTSTIGSVTFQIAVGASAGTTTFSGVISQASTGTLAVSKIGAGKAVLSGANTYTGATTIAANGGTLVAKSGGATTGALGASTSSAAVTVNTGSTLEIDGSAGDIVLTKSNAQLSIGGTGDSSKGVIYSSAGANNSYTAASIAMTTSSTIQVAAASKLTLTGVISGGGFNLTKTSAGELALASANTYTGLTSIVGTLSVATLANGGAASGVGQSTNIAANLLVGTSAAAGVLKHTGAASTTDRNWTAGTAGATIDASGTGVLTMTSTTAPAFSGAGTATITVQGSAGDGVTTFNTYSQPVSNNSGSAVGFTKAGSGAWKLTNATLDFTGTLTSSGTGFLDLNGTARVLTSNIVISGGTIQNGSASVTPASSITMTGGKITANLAGASKTLSVTSGSAELAPQATNNNGLSGGTTTVSGGTLRLTTEASDVATVGGKVLGSMAVAVTSGGTLQTTSGTVQRGRMRYGGNLTLNTGATLRIGG